MQRAQLIMDAFYKDFGEPPHYDDKIAVANVLQCLIEEYSEVRGTGRVDKKSKVVTVKTLMKLIEELK